MKFISNKLYIPVHSALCTMHSFSFYALCALLCALLFSSCSEDLDVSGGIYNNSSDNYINVNFLIQEETHVSTRDYDENGVNHLTVFIFNNNSEGDLLQKIEYQSSQLTSSSESNQFTLTIEKNDAVKKADKLWIYAVANAQTELDDITVGGSKKSVNDINDVKVPNVIYNTNNESKGFFMSGTAFVSANTEIDLVRSAAKVNVKNESTVDNFVLEGFEIFNPAIDCFVTAGISGKKTDNSAKSGDDIKQENFDKGTQYTSSDEHFYRFTNPTYTSNFYTEYKTDVEEATIYSYIVIYGKYTDENYPSGVVSYYAIPLFDQTNRVHYDIDPNHWYDIAIKEVNNKGEQDAISAVKSPCDYIIYEIHDHAPEVFSMISDGVHELGVRGVVEIDPANSDDDGMPYGYLTVKLYSANKNELSSINSGLIEFDITNTPWFKIITDNPEDVTPADTDPEDNPGKQYRYKVKLTSPRFSEQSQEVKISWKGLSLSRIVTVHYNPGFNIAEACKVDLVIKDENGNTKHTIEDYWKFISQAVDYDNQKLYGVGSNEMADGKVRNQGFHLPMPLGKNAPDNPWVYEYNVDFTDLMKGDTRTITGITCTTSGNAELANMISWANDSQNPQKGVLKLSDAYKNSYSYATGKIIFHFTYNNNDTRTVTVDLYHTGFFHHYDNFEYDATTIVDSFMENNEFYYYEVIEMEGNYWLDRNLGAKSNRMFVDDSSQDGLGYKDSRGQYLKICKYIEAQYTDPTVINDMCPPGYHIPVSSEWNSIRLSANFMSPTITDNGQTYITTYYKSPVGNVYFPRAKYYNSTSNVPIVWHEEDAKSGDPSTGYYWTSTAAPGMEKLEMGKWLRALYINGSNSTYQNMNVVESKMNVRCVAGASIPAQDNYYVSIFVHNVTHVYLFDPSTGGALYTFPGDAVGTTASANKWQNFTCFTSVDISKLGMLFAKKESDGSITLFTRSNGKDESFSSFNITNQNFSSTINTAIENGNYWNVENGLFYDFCIERNIFDEEGNITETINYKEKRENDNVSNVYNKQPELKENQECDYCSYTEKQESSSGNGNGGGNQYYDFEPEYDYEIDTQISQLQCGSSWGQNQELAYGGYDWSNVTVGSKIKIYLVPTGGDTVVQTFTAPENSGWSSIAEFRSYRNSINDPEIKVIEIELTSYILNRIKNERGFVVQATNCVLVGITIVINEDYVEEEEDITKLHPKEFNWSGNQTITWSEAWTPLAYGAYDWSQVPAGTILKITFASTGGQFNVLDSNWSHIDDGIKPSSIIYEYVIPKDKLDRFRYGNGLLIQGENLTITAATLIFPEGTGTN